MAAEDIADFGCNDVADDISADLLLLKQQQRPVLPLLDVRNQDISIKTNRISSTKEIHPAVDSAEKLLFLSDLKYFIHTRYNFCVFELYKLCETFGTAHTHTHSYSHYKYEHRIEN